jgi:2-aminoethylphosphonate-pyruvate transaminase
MSKLLLNPGPTNTRFLTKVAQWIGSDTCHRTDEFYESLRDTKKHLLNLMSFKADRLFHAALFGGSGTTAMEAMISSLIPCDGDVTLINAGKYGVRAMKMMNVYRIPFKEVISSNIDDLRKNPFTKRVYFVENETSTGEKYDLQKMKEIYPNAQFFIDATSAFGASDYRKHLDCIAALSFCSNKCLQSTPGVSAVIFKKDLDIVPKTCYMNLDAYIKDEMPFTMPVQSISALRYTLYNTFGNEKTFNSRRNRIISDVSKFGIVCLNKHPCNAIIGFRHPTKTYEQLKQCLLKKDIVIYSGIDGIENSFRISTISVDFDRKYSKLLKALKSTI